MPTKIRLKIKAIGLNFKEVNDLHLFVTSGRELHNTGAIYE